MSLNGIKPPLQMESGQIIFYPIAIRVLIRYH